MGAAGTLTAARAMEAAAAVVVAVVATVGARHFL